MLEKKTEKVDLRIEPTLKWKLDELVKKTGLKRSVLLHTFIVEGLNKRRR
jgi:hypothetical protein